MFHALSKKIQEKTKAFDNIKLIEISSPGSK